MSGLKFKNGLSVDECTECWGSGCDVCLGSGYDSNDYHCYMMEQAEEEETGIQIMRAEVKCSFCGIKTRNQPSGDGCHSCIKGIMRPTGN